MDGSKDDVHDYSLSLIDGDTVSSGPVLEAVMVF